LISWVNEAQCRNNIGGRVCNAFPGQVLCYGRGPSSKGKIKQVIIKKKKKKGKSFKYIKS